MATVPRQAVRRLSRSTGERAKEIVGHLCGVRRLAGAAAAAVLLAVHLRQQCEELIMNGRKTDNIGGAQLNQIEDSCLRVNHPVRPCRRVPA
jgi:hypothetical protein